MATGAALGAGAAAAMQHSDNRCFNKQETFTVELEPHEERYETGRFPVNKWNKPGRINPGQTLKHPH